MKLMDVYNRMFDRFGPRNWWPTTLPGEEHPSYNGEPLDARRRFEIAVGAILTQNTNWGNVERALVNLNKKGLINPRKLIGAPVETVETAIRPSGYFRIKTDRLLAMSRWWLDNIDDHHLPDGDIAPWRESILSVKGVGQETADSILLYCFDMPTFVIDAYTKRIMARHGGTPPNIPYEELRAKFLDELPADIQLFKEFHALFVELAKVSCKSRECLPDCVLRS